MVKLKRDLRLMADDAAATGEWLAAAMEASWAAAESLLDLAELADVLGERHRIIANDWQAAGMSSLVGRLLGARWRSSTGSSSSQPTSGATWPGPIARRGCSTSAAEIVGHAADVLSDSATLDGDNERRWRTFRSRVRDLLAASEVPGEQPEEP